MLNKDNNKIIWSAKKLKRKYWYEVADILGVSENTIIRMMRKELPLDEQKRIADLILNSSEGE